VRVLITGNMGYVGPVVVTHLRARFPEAELWGFDAGYFGACLTGTASLPESWLDRQVFGDVRDFDPTLLEDVDGIVHLAAISNDPIGNAYEDVTYEINYRATVNLARLARDAGVRRFVFASSCSMYGFADSGPRSESSPLNPLTPYAKSKAMAEAELAELATEQFTVTSLRFATACGMSPRLRLDLVLNDFVACAVVGDPITVLSDGTPWRPLINVHDMARAVEWALIREAADGDHALSINAGSDEWNYQVRDLATSVAASVEGGRVSINEAAMPDRRSYRVSFDRFRTLAPDHQPRVGLSDAITEVRSGLVGMGFNDHRFRESTMMRIVHLTRLREAGLLDGDLRWRRP
jgi:nucleoside-diphosphate-sugar epimerase